MPEQNPPVLDYLSPQSSASGSSSGPTVAPLLVNLLLQLGHRLSCLGWLLLPAAVYFHIKQPPDRILAPTALYFALISIVASTAAMRLDSRSSKHGREPLGLVIFSGVLAAASVATILYLRR